MRTARPTGVWCRCCAAFTVFNVAQVDGLPEGMAPSRWSQAWEPLDAADDILACLAPRSATAARKAFYAPDADLIQLPPRSAFDCAGDYYATALHELTHWTGHASRCNRVLGRRHGIDAYAFEELVAEMGSAFPHRLLRHRGPHAARQLHRELAGSAAQRQAADLHCASAGAAGCGLPAAGRFRACLVGLSGRARGLITLGS
jgi:antirestriction protein ArdC